MPPRTKKIRHDEETRSKIQAAQIINRFQSCLNGEIVLDAQQVSVGKALLNKVLPDLSSVEYDGTVEHEVGDTLSDLMAAIANRGKRLTDAGDS